MNRKSDQLPPPHRQARMGVTIGAKVFRDVESAQEHLDREAREHRARCALRAQQILAGGAA